jgi:hypothetical protein
MRFGLAFGVRRPYIRSARSLQKGPKTKNPALPTLGFAPFHGLKWQEAWQMSHAQAVARRPRQENPLETGQIKLARKSMI